MDSLFHGDSMFINLFSASGVTFVWCLVCLKHTHTRKIHEMCRLERMVSLSRDDTVKIWQYSGSKLSVAVNIPHYNQHRALGHSLQARDADLKHAILNWRHAIVPDLKTDSQNINLGSLFVWAKQTESLIRFGFICN